jgi:alpha-D-xyloside xylohydrolase
MVGDQLLIAPLFTGETKRSVVLPAGKWYDFYTGKFVGESEVITATPGLDHIPVYVRDGGIVPMATVSAVTPGKYDLIIRHYGDKEAEYHVYDDDGQTYDYEHGAYSWRKISVKRNNKGQLQGSIAPAEKGKPDNIGSVSWEFKSVLTP